MRLCFLVLCILSIVSISCSASFFESIYKQLPSKESFLRSRARMSLVLGTDFHREYFGGLYAHEHTQIQVRHLMQRMGFKDSCTIHVMYLNDCGMNEFGTENLIACANTILIDQEWFDQLTSEEQRFLLAHELAHIYYQDVRVMSLVAGVAAGLITHKAFKCLSEEESLWSYAGLVACFLLMVPTFGRYLEQRADLHAAKTVGDIQGGVECFKRWMQEQRGNESSSSIQQFYYDVIATHPSAQRRLEALEALKMG